MLPIEILESVKGARCLSSRVLGSRPRGRGFEPHRRHCVVSLNKNINKSLVLVPPRKIRPIITEILLMGRKESNQIKSKLENVPWRKKQQTDCTVPSKIMIQGRRDKILF